MSDSHIFFFILLFIALSIHLFIFFNLYLSGMTEKLFNKKKIYQDYNVFNEKSLTDLRTLIPGKYYFYYFNNGNNYTGYFKFIGSEPNEIFSKTTDYVLLFNSKLYNNYYMIYNLFNKIDFIVEPIEENTYEHYVVSL